MIHPNQIAEKQFEKSFVGGYKASDVDQFFYTVSKDYVELYVLKEELEKKIAILAEKINEYKMDEEHIKEAILYSQKIRDDVMVQVNEAAENIMKEAQEKHDEVMKELEENKKSKIAQADAEFNELQRKNKKAIEKESRALTAIKKEVSSFKHKLQETYKTHLNSIMSLPFYDEKEDDEIDMPSLDEPFLDEVTIDIIENNTQENLEEEAVIENIEIISETSSDEDAELDSQLS